MTNAESEIANQIFVLPICDQSDNPLFMAGTTWLHWWLTTVNAFKTPHYVVTQMSRSWSWVIDSHPSPIDGLVQERRNFSPLAMELHLSCTDPLLCQSALPFLKYSYFKFHYSRVASYGSIKKMSHCQQLVTCHLSLNTSAVSQHVNGYIWPIHMKQTLF